MLFDFEYKVILKDRIYFRRYILNLKIKKKIIILIRGVNIKLLI